MGSISGKKFRSLKSILLVKILLASSSITAALTLISFYTDYSSEMGELENTLIQIETVAIPSLGEDLWNIDDKAIESQVASIVKLQEIVAATIKDEENKIVFSKDSSNGTTEYIFTQNYPIKYDDQTIGSVKLLVTKQYIYKRLAQRIVVFAFTQGIKTFLVSFIILYIFSFYVTVHLTSIVEFFKSTDYLSNKLSLSQRDDKTFSELDIMVESINEMAASVKKQEGALQADVDLHKASRINSARLASLGEMAGGIAHEINNPLAIVEGYLHIIKIKVDSGNPDPESVFGLIEKTLLTCSRINTVLLGLKTYTRNTTNDPMIHTNLDGIVNKCVSLVTERMKINGVSIRTSKNDPSLGIMCRENEITQVIVNMLNNSLDAVQNFEAKWVSIDCGRRGDFVTVTITDSGLGISQHITEKIFDPFFTTKEIGQGTGLGLSVAKNIVENHEGTFEIDSHNTNTSFVLSFPSPVRQKVNS
ncbi:ATP-binding protein [bacterium]|nr:ATP-binding protein [bacterium]